MSKTWISPAEGLYEEGVPYVVDATAALPVHETAPEPFELPPDVWLDIGEKARRIRPGDGSRVELWCKPSGAWAVRFMKSL